MKIECFICGWQSTSRKKKYKKRDYCPICKLKIEYFDDKDLDVNNKHLNRFNKILHILSQIEDKDRLYERLAELMDLYKTIKATASLRDVEIKIPYKYKQFYYERKNELHEELQSLKQRISLALFNNEKCNHLISKRNNIASKLGYKNDSDKSSSKNDRYSYGAYKITPSKVITVYRGGGCSGR